MKHIPIIFRNLYLLNWEKSFKKMSIFTQMRNKNTLDEIWFAEHYPVYTLGQIEHSNNQSNIHGVPVVHSNRGGKITYHGPGQQVVYLLLDLKRMKINIRQLLFFIEKVILNTLYYFSILSHNSSSAPGIYINKKKVCSIGFRIKKGCCFHGFALNVNMDLQPFQYIKPCGNSRIVMTNVSNFKKNITLSHVRKILIQNFLFFLKLYCI